MRYCTYGLLMILVLDAARVKAFGDQPLLFTHKSDVGMPCLSPNGKALAVITSDRDVFLWNVQTQTKQRLVEGRAVTEEDEYPQLTNVQFSPDSQKLATIDCVRGIVRVWKIEERGQAKLWKTLRIAHLTEEGMVSVEFTSKGEELVVAARFLLLPNKLKADGSGEFDVDGKGPFGLAFLIRKYDIASGRNVPISRKYSWSTIVDIAVSPRGSRLFVSEFGVTRGTGAEFFRTRAIDLGTRKEVYRIAGCLGPITPSPNGKFVAGTHAGLFPSGTHLITKLWDMKTGRELHSFKESDALTGAPSFSPDSRLMAFPATGKTVRVWNINEKRFILTRTEKSQPDSVQFLPNGKLLAVAVDGKTVKLWNLTDAKLPKITRK